MPTSHSTSYPKRSQTHILPDNPLYHLSNSGPGFVDYSFVLLHSLLNLCHSPCIVKEGQIGYTSVSVLLFCFLCQVSQKELQAMETMTAAFIHKFPRVTPELFVDLSQFIPFMSVSDIMSFPASLIVNDSVWVANSRNDCILFTVSYCVRIMASVLPFRLTAIRDHSSGMKSLQKKAFVKRLLQSSVVGDVPTWPPYFLSSILPLLPYIPVSHFQQLTSQQVRYYFNDLKIFA